MKRYRWTANNGGMVTDWVSDEIGLYFSERLNELLKLLEVGEKYVKAGGTWERML